MTADNPVKRTDVDKALLGSATYRSLGEQRLTPAEERFEKGRRTVGLFLARSSRSSSWCCRSTSRRSNRRSPPSCSG